MSRDPVRAAVLADRRRTDEAVRLHVKWHRVVGRFDVAEHLQNALDEVRRRRREADRKARAKRSKR